MMRNKIGFFVRAIKNGLTLTHSFTPTVYHQIIHIPCHHCFLTLASFSLLLVCLSLLLCRHSQTALLHLKPDPKAICSTLWPLVRSMWWRT